MSEVRIEHVFKRFGDVTAVSDFDLTVKDGEFVSLLGPSGCGKTTSLRMIAGFERATEGEIYIGDHCVSSHIKNTFVPPEKRDIGMVFQSYAVWPHMTVTENVAYPLKIQKVPKEERAARVAEMLKLVHLDEYGSRYPHQLSGGQQQRVALARALVMRPGLLLLDEPLSNLDAKLRESMRFEISSIQKELGITVIYVTHDQSEAMTMSDRVVVMSRGVIQQIGTPYEIYRNPANKMVADFIGLVNFVEGEVQGDRVYISGTGVSFPNTSGVTGSATIAVRPENITMSRTSGTIEGTLVHRFYLGDAVDYRVQCKHHVIRVIVKGAELKEFTDGEKVYLDFDKIMVFDRD
ncbi:ABC transporter ATP-binding protein [Phascolarctobacterium sp. ET69]|uniref:ABC transporter ATP-binding protein n=1 Tax=Phascolarctobacterium sp. ET69 TaxID=2939420 RepID=UPI002011D2E7|nr:ABC transporter ATP-binding protein [Phascolarctobacterium sp. ET69]MCL1604953.1 ABC transporter ATP-binding protein [Phascolarctobacterium sp. ET69]